MVLCNSRVWEFGAGDERQISSEGDKSGPAGHELIVVGRVGLGGG